MNILFITCNFRMFDGIDCGAANRSTMFVKSLTKLGHVDVISFYKEPLTSNITNCEVVGNYPTKTKELSTREKLYRLFRLLVTPWSTKAYYEVDKQCEAIVREQLGKKNYDIVACRYIYEAVKCGLHQCSDKLVIDVDDNLRAASLRDYKTAKFNHWYGRCIFLYQTLHIEWMTKHFLRKAKVSFYSNILEPVSKKSKFLHNVTTIGNPCKDISENTPCRILFVGWLDFSPNKYGILHFVENVFPRIKERIPEVELHVVGKTKDQQLKDRLNAIEGVKALGFVEYVYEEYENCRVAILPVYQGAGTSVKFVEGLMMNRPMVSTPMGARGYEAKCRSGKEYLLANSDEEFASRVCSLLNSPAQAKEIAANAYKVGKENFSAECYENIVVNNIKKAFVGTTTSPSPTNP